ncbi:MAG: serine/threonine protein kinase with repeat [Pedosphaera sp.]|nr:serine/threonine protein kinase with repeat [Pedosphaera sp.]
MSAPASCSGCGAALSPEVAGGHCLACLLQFGLAAEAGDVPGLKPGDRVGRYKLIEQIGEGGCGVVFEAEQLEPVRRRVALKVIKPGMDTRQVIARFEAERQALALLDHPNIAKVFDAGATESGRPYFVMEFVPGEKITDYCDGRKFSTLQRLELFAQVCRAVQHAHQKGIIHRDLKPSNILVADDGAGAGVPKIIDFGIAKSTEQPLTELTLVTAFQQFMGTPAYMSPEQAGAGDVDTRSDIYSLGVLLYELLTGLTPFDAAELRRLAMDEILRFIRDAEPARPSTRLTILTQQELSAVATCRQSEPARLPQLLRGDLDWIVMKCLDKDRVRRYETASALAQDLQRHLANEPVAARPPGAWYRFGKMVRRNKLATGAALAVAFALILGTVVSTDQAVRAWRAEREQSRLRQEAEAEAAKSREVAAFLKNILAGTGPSVALGRDTTMLREILDQAAARLGRELTNQPGARAELLGTLADTYHELGRYREMGTAARESLWLSRPSAGIESLAVAKALEQLGDALMHLGKLSDAENFTREGLAMRRKILGNEHPEVSAAINNLGLVLREQGRMQDAEMLFRESLAMDRKLLGNDSPKIAVSLDNLGAVLWGEGRLGEAEAAYREGLELRREIFGDNHPDVATSLNNLATVLLSEKKFAEAETMNREALAMDRKFLGDAHPDLVIALGNLGNALAAQGKLAEAETADREALAINRKLLGNDHPDVAAALETLSKDLAGQGKLEAALAARREAQVIRNLQAVRQNSGPLK